MSAVGFHVLALPTQTSQPRSAVELPLPLTLPWPAGQLRKTVHAEWPTALLEKWFAAHNAQPLTTTGSPATAAAAYSTVPLQPSAHSSPAQVLTSVVVCAVLPAAEQAIEPETSGGLFVSGSSAYSALHTPLHVPPLALHAGATVAW